MNDIDRALDDLDAADLRAVKAAAHEAGRRHLDDGAPRHAALWHALSVIAAEAEDRRAATLLALEREFDAGVVTFDGD